MISKIVRSDDQIAFYLQGGAKNVAAIHIGVSIEHKCCPICHLNIKKLLNHFKTAHYNNNRHTEYYNLVFGILQEYETFIANEHSRTDVAYNLKTPAVYRLIKDFDIPTMLVADMLHKSFFTIANLYSLTMPKEGWVKSVGVGCIYT